jgi:hypothetical protein
MQKESHCKECPWKVKNKHNSTIVAFSERTGRAHNCHMTEGVKNLWEPEEKHLCKKFKNYKSLTL